MGTRLAVLVGCNYKNTNQELTWPINNVGLWKHQLMRHFRFEDQHITVMTDDGRTAMPTREKILDALNNMVNGAKARDVFFFHFSGQGILQPSGHPAIVASDLQLVTDMEFQRLVKVATSKEASFIILADCSHSGGLIYGEKVQIGPKPDKPVPYHPDAGILLSACQADEIANKYDDPVTTTPYGAFTYAVKTVLEGYPSAIITNKELVFRVRDELPLMEIAGQHPCLYCSDDNANANFLLLST